MTERPIIFSAPMVRSVLDGSKTVTRRVVKYQAPDLVDDDGWPLVDRSIDGIGEVRAACPYGQSGDRLWVRETWQAIDGNELALRIMTEPHPSRGWIEYAATVPEGHEPPPRWRPSIHMPRWSSRITLEVTGVRVERMQDISEVDAISEGVRQMRDGSECWVGREGPRGLVTPWPTAREAFRDLWQSINGPDSWTANPWVFVIEFKRINP